jgi:hypothetical protein
MNLERIIKNTAITVLLFSCGCYSVPVEREPKNIETYGSVKEIKKKRERKIRVTFEDLRGVKGSDFLYLRDRDFILGGNANPFRVTDSGGKDYVKAGDIGDPKDRRYIELPDGL